VIYTSGSTGAPKGVAVEHHSLVSSTQARIAFYPAPRAFLLLSAVAFDSAMAGIFGTLTQGSALCLPPAGMETDPREIARLIAAHRIDALLALPSLYELLLEAAEGAQLASLRTVIVAGERCPPRLVTQSRARVPTAALVNEYGPTEATIWSTAWRAPPHPAAPPQSTVPIGRPIDGVRVWLRDGSGQQVAAGETGELCVSGAGVARGYLGRPDLTAAVFVADPAGPPGARLYRTGDLARQRADGELEFVGRMDRQLKIRGFRIEPAEIEEAILRLGGVRQAVVMESPRAPGAALAAFVTADGLTPAQVRQSLGDRLPAYMVPTEVCLLEALPLTLTGKVDHRMLASMLTQADGAAADPPRSPTERVVAQLWREVLHRAPIGRSDNFLDLGQSLDAMRIALQLSQLFRVEVPLLWVYEAPTVEAIAQLLESMVANASTIAATWLATHEAHNDGRWPRGDDDHDEEPRG
jgi:acyl-coenzyme A synthetase/AMP-(fatty) acid ligase